jgi:hypothetical protein
MLAAHNQEYKDAKEFSDWMPDDGDYVLLIGACEKGISNKNDQQLLWWKHTAQVVAGDNYEQFADRDFTSMFCSSRNFSIAKSQAKILNGGTAPANIEELNAVFEGAEGKLVKAQIKTSDKGYTNCYYRELVAEDAPDTPEGGVPEEPPAN